jgi:hypothetical protein
LAAYCALKKPAFAEASVESGCTRLVDNPAIRQRPLELFQARGGDLGVFEPQLIEIGQSFKVFKPNVCDLGAIELQSFKSAKARKTREPAVRDFSAVEAYGSKLGQPFQTF